MKRVIFTESQIKRLLGEDVFSYSNGSASSKEGGHGLDKTYTAQQTGEIDSEEETRGTGPTLDKKYSETCPTGYFGQISRHYMAEENERLNGRQFDGKSAGSVAYLKHKRDVDGVKLSKKEESLVNQVDNARTQIKSQKKLMSDLGAANQFQKAGGTKNSGNGKAHTKKNSNNVFITYEK